MADLTERLEAKVSKSASLQLRMLALAKGKPISHVLDEHLMATLPSADESYARLQGTEAIPA